MNIQLHVFPHKKEARRFVLFEDYLGLQAKVTRLEKDKDDMRATIYALHRDLQDSLAGRFKGRESAVSQAALTLAKPYLEEYAQRPLPQGVAHRKLVW